ARQQRKIPGHGHSPLLLTGLFAWMEYSNMGKPWLTRVYLFALQQKRYLVLQSAIFILHFNILKISA
ncbi:MAG: hypothetical protein IJD16_05155, partial [Desulfovibrio sp.]|nr:hypothetical protein [Desulfovibrio sp.]